MQLYFESREVNSGGYALLWAQIVVFPKTCVGRFALFCHSRAPGVAAPRFHRPFETYEAAAAAAKEWVTASG